MTRNEEKGSARAEGAVRTFASSAMRLIILQVVIAALALGAVAFAALRLGDVTRATEAMRTELQTATDARDAAAADLAVATTELAESKARVQAASAALGDLVEGAKQLVGALREPAGEARVLSASGAAARLSRAKSQWEAVNPGAGDPLILRMLAEAQHASGSSAAAFATVSQAMAAAGPDAAPADRIADLVARALYGCASGDASGAEALAAAGGDAAEAFRVDRRLVAGNRELQSACARLPAAARALAGATGSGAAETASAPDASAYRITQVFLHIAVEDDRAKAKAVEAELEKLGYRVLGIELVPSDPGRNRSIRYFYDAQKEAGFVDRLQDDCVAAAKAAGLGEAWQARYREVSLDGKYERLPLNRVEIWF